MPARMRIYHGGAPDLQVGDPILPPCETGAVTISAVARKHDVTAYRLTGRLHSRPDRVYVSRLEVAARFAVAWTINPMVDGDGAVYEVEMIGEGEADPGMPEADQPSWACERAVITRVAKPGVSREEAMRMDPRWLSEAEPWFHELAEASREGRCVSPAFHAGRLCDVMARVAAGRPAPGTNWAGVTLKVLGF